MRKQTNDVTVSKAAVIETSAALVVVDDLVVQRSRR
jgi:hypothetical protein